MTSYYPTCDRVRPVLRFRGSVWIGLNDITDEAETTWADGTPWQASHYDIWKNSQANTGMSDASDERQARTHLIRSHSSARSCFELNGVRIKWKK